MILPDDTPKPDLHPDRLRAIAELMGLPKPACVNQARILLLGVGFGANLLALASSLPHAKFSAVFVDKTAEENARAAAEHLGCDNIRWFQLDAWLQLNKHPKMDYVLCHGLFGYLPPAKKDAVMAAMRHSLSRNGLAYVDYLTQPGWQAFVHIQNAIALTNLHVERPEEDAINHGLNVLYQHLPHNSPLRSSMDAIIPHMTLRTHLKLNGYWSLLPAHAEQVDDFIARLHQHQFGYVCDSHIQRYYFAPLPTELDAAYGADNHAREMLYDFLHETASRASLIMPMQQLVGYHLPTKADITARIDHLHVSGRFDFNAEQGVWLSPLNPQIHVKATVFNDMLMQSLNRVYDAHSTLSVSSLLEVIHNTFSDIADANVHARTLLADLILAQAVHIRSERQTGFAHQEAMQQLHQWRMAHQPYLTPADAWLQPLSDEYLSTSALQDAVPPPSQSA